MNVNLFLLSLIFGVCFSQRLDLAKFRKLLDDEEEVSTTVRALRKIIKSGTKIEVACIMSGNCREIDFVSSLPRKKETCTRNDHCSDFYSFCSGYRCECPENYLQRGRRCYGMLEARCTESSQCLSTGFVCQNGLCLDPFEKTIGDTNCTQKPESPVCWGNKPSGPLCRIFGNNKDFTVQGVITTSSSGQIQCEYIWFGNVKSLSNFEYLQMTDDMKWVNPFENLKLENAVYGGVSEGSQATLFCRTKPQSTYYGRLSPPNYDICQFSAEGIILAYRVFEILVYV